MCGGMDRDLVLDFRQTDLTPTTNIKGEINKEGIRKKPPREWARLKGYPYNFNIVVVPTLVNASLLTNFHYRLTNPLTQDQIDFVNNMVV